MALSAEERENLYRYSQKLADAEFRYLDESARHEYLNNTLASFRHSFKIYRGGAVGCLALIVFTIIIYEFITEDYNRLTDNGSNYDGAVYVAFGLIYNAILVLQFLLFVCAFILSIYSLRYRYLLWLNGESERAVLRCEKKDMENLSQAEFVSSVKLSKIMTEMEILKVKLSEFKTQ